MEHPRVSIIILNWNSWRDTIECLESVYRIDYPNYDVIVVDNASRDESIQKIKEYARGNLKVKSKFFDYTTENKPIKIFELSEEEALQGKLNRPLYGKYDPNRRLIIIKNRDNYGYAKGNNIGIKFALSVLYPEYVLILNPDTVVNPHLLETLIQNIDCDTGVAGPTVYFYDFNGKTNIISFAGAFLVPERGRELRLNFKRDSDSLPPNPREVEKIEGSCMLVRKDVFFEVGLFKEEFFCYWEETDLCVRAKKKSFKLLHVPQASIWHKVGALTGGYLSDFYTYHYYRNRLWFLRDNYPQKVLIFHLFYVLLYEIYFKLVQLVFKYKRPKTFIKYALAIADGLFSR
ncbi:glycosyltransferase family 2 protein [Thermococcus sp. 5-4]|uniref:glycosyltransferase family 2 protein n=1 Tax=Thermococcus sp. 5-4 TaxID=2008440 RepID=UPI000B4A2F26|nr:glycosyltransferase family 2 protein [Thermococcus sp. 5-4]ASA78491.1 glycosyl transferase family 2 [Thermococcus sp. 5-4]